jgi:transcriptional regulator with XRE-family HTH domain
MIFRNLVRQYRERLEWRQSDVSARLNLLGSDIDQGAVSDIESGKRAVKVRDLVLLAHVLDIPDEVLLKTLAAELDAALTEARPQPPKHGVKKRPPAVVRRFRTRASGER